MANTQKSKQSTEVPSSSTDSIASCSSKAHEPNECSKTADSSLDAPKLLEKIDEPHTNVDKDETDREETNKDDADIDEAIKEANDKEIVEKLDDEVACYSSSPKSEAEQKESDDQKDELASSTSKFSPNDDENNEKDDDDTLIDIEDPDDYLLYLETILVKIHSRFYTHYDETKQVFISQSAKNTFPIAVDIG